MVDDLCKLGHADSVFEEVRKLIEQQIMNKF